MARSMLKYFNDRGGDEHGGLLYWPGTLDGFPFRGPQAPDLKQHELETLPLGLDFHSKMFRLWEPLEKAEFDEISDRIVNGWYMQRKREDRWIEQHTHFAVWLEWVQIYGELPNAKTPPASHVFQPQPAAQNGAAARPAAAAQAGGFADHPEYGTGWLGFGGHGPGFDGAPQHAGEQAFGGGSYVISPDNYPDYGAPTGR